MSKYNQTYQAVIDSNRKYAGKGKWKITKYSKDWALVEHFIDTKWVAQGSIPVKWIVS